jgi:hypothetical protein
MSERRNGSSSYSRCAARRPVPGPVEPERPVGVADLVVGQAAVLYRARGGLTDRAVGQAVTLEIGSERLLHTSSRTSDTDEQPVARHARYLQPLSSQAGRDSVDCRFCGSKLLSILTGSEVVVEERRRRIGDAGDEGLDLPLVAWSQNDHRRLVRRSGDQTDGLGSGRCAGRCGNRGGRWQSNRGLGGGCCGSGRQPDHGQQHGTCGSNHR